MPDPDQPRVSDRWRAWRRRTDLDEYDQRWSALEADGVDIHGEADLIERFASGVVVDGGCGTGRVGIELGRRGHVVIGIDNDAEMLARARAKDPTITWLVADLAEVELSEPVGTIALAGNVLIFVEPGSEAAVVANLAGQLTRDGVFIAGHSLASGARSVAEYDRWAAGAGLLARHRYSGWDGDGYAGGDYCVFVDQRPA